MGNSRRRRRNVRAARGIIAAILLRRPKINTFCARLLYAAARRERTTAAAVSYPRPANVPVIIWQGPRRDRLRFTDLGAANSHGGGGGGNGLARPLPRAIGNRWWWRRWRQCLAQRACGSASNRAGFASWYFIIIRIVFFARKTIYTTVALRGSCEDSDKNASGPCHTGFFTVPQNTIPVKTCVHTFCCCYLSITHTRTRPICLL